LQAPGKSGVNFAENLIFGMIFPSSDTAYPWLNELNAPAGHPHFCTTLPLELSMETDNAYVFRKLTNAFSVICSKNNSLENMNA
jgi:hypothetical protein